MNIIKLFVIVLTVLITLCVAGLKPKMHKHFILVSPSFKLTNNNQNPKDMQSVFLFKTGSAKNQQQKIVKSVESEQNDYYTQRKTKIIPSSFFSEQGASVYSEATSQAVDTTSSQYNKLSSIDNAKAWAELEKRIHEQRDAYNKNKNSSNKNEKNNPASEDSVNFFDSFGGKDFSCPVCEELHDAQYKDDIVAWNIWRSNLQNRIMDEVDIDAYYGTIFFFTFKVDNNRNITNIKVQSTDFMNREAIDAVRKAIVRLNGQPILKFPKNTSRESVDFRGAFVISTYSQYSTPSDYNDYERIRMRY